MGTVVSEQLRAYLTAAALGAAAEAIYDLLRLVRLRRRRNRRLTHGLDAAFLLLVAPALLWYALRVGQGELRLIMLTAMGLGAAVYLLALSPLMRPLWDFWLSTAASTGRLLWLPVKKFTAAGKSQAKNAVLFQQTILRYFVHFWQHEKATRQSPAGSLCFIVLFPCYFRVLCVRFSLKYERAGAARPPPPSTRPAPCSHSARLKPFAGSCSSRFGFA